MALLLWPTLSFSQTENAGPVAKMWSYPVVYNYDEKVSWYFDLTGTTFPITEDVYLWIWSPSEPDAGNWGNSSDFAKLTHVKDMIWKFDVTPTTYFNKTPAEIKASAGFWFRLKNKTGTLQSDVAKVPVTDFSDFATSAQPMAFYPEKVYIDQPVSILFNSNLVPGFTGVPSVHMHGGLNDFDAAALQEYQAWKPDITTKTQLVDMGNGIYRKDIIPGEYFNAPANYVMKNISFLFVGKDWAITSPNYKIFAADVVVPPPPVLSFFPQKVSKKDIFIITRQFNDAGQNLNYTITGGGQTVTGSFAGNADLQRAFINLNQTFGSVSIDKLHLTLKDQRNNILYDGDITLTSLD